MTPQARRRWTGGIIVLPTQSRSGDGSPGIAATTGNVRAQGTAPNLQAALTGGGGELCGHVLPRGSAIGHRAFAWVWGVAGARWSGVWARTAAGPCPFVSYLKQPRICLNRAWPMVLSPALWLD